MKNGCVVDQYGQKRWYVNGIPHREDGPATEYTNGEKYWYLNGYLYSEKEFKILATFSFVYKNFTCKLCEAK